MGEAVVAGGVGPLSSPHADRPLIAKAVATSRPAPRPNLIQDPFIVRQHLAVLAAIRAGCQGSQISRHRILETTGANRSAIRPIQRGHTC